MRDDYTVPINTIVTHPELADPNFDFPSAIRSLKEKLDAVILAHYYQDASIQDVADFIGDSLDLSRKAQATQAKTIVFCGVRFMAEVAKILNPTKMVLIPDMKAGCSLEEACPPKAFAQFRKEHPEHIALTYINCSAEVKALSDIIVTSSNAESIIRQIPKDRPILFSPDKHLGRYLMRKTDRDMLLWDGSCMVHEQFSAKALVQLMTRYPEAYVIAHPECPEALLHYAHHIGSTSSLIKFTMDHPGAAFIVLTEPGIIHQMKKVSPNSRFFEVAGSLEGGCVSCNNCPYMRLNTLEKLYITMKTSAPELILSAEVASKALPPLETMLRMSQNISISTKEPALMGV